MHSRASSRSSTQRRPRLLRASVTEPSIFTSTGSQDFDMAPSTSSYRSTSSRGSSSSSGDGSSAYRRATDLLNHVAYLSSCATSPLLSPRRSSPQSTDSRPPTAASAVISASRSHNGSGNSNGSGHLDDNSVEACRRRNTDEVFGSSPASTHTTGSLEDLHPHHARSANYYSFPSFDMYDDNQDKEEDIDS